MHLVDFYRQRFGKNWVLHRRTRPIVEKYGDDVVCLTNKQYDAATRDYRAEFGSPHDKVRAALYLSLKRLCELHAKPCYMGDPFTHLPEWQAALDALKAEREATA